MALPVYSASFGREPSVSGGPVALYTVPPGKIAVVKCMTITYGNIIASGLDAWFQDDATCKLCRYAWAFGPGTPTNYGGTALFFGDSAGYVYALDATSGKQLWKMRPDEHPAL